MITLNDRFSFYKSHYDWRLVETYAGMDKNRASKLYQRQTYHPSLDAIAKAIIDRCAGDCKSMNELRELLARAGETVADHLTFLAKETE